MAEPRTAWATSPNGRGTLDVIWSCLSTLALCVWTAVHPNIQLQPNQLRTLRARLLLMVTAVLFPEIVISAAWRQLELARWLRSRLCDSNQSHMKMAGLDPTNQGLDVDNLGTLLRNPSNKSTTTDRASSTRNSDLECRSHEDLRQHQPVQWNNKQAFFAIMGGFTVDATWVNDKQQEVKQNRSFTAKGIEYLFLADAVPDLGEDDVDERNNTDLFAKAIVIVQISWFAAQTVARLATKLPLSALEIHTVVHAICAIIMYAIWKDKPYALSRSILLKDSQSKRVMALLTCKERLHEIHREQVVRFEREREAYWTKRAVRALQVDRGEVAPDQDPPPQPRLPRPALLAEILEIYATADTDSFIPSFGDYGDDEDYYDDSVFRSMAADAYSTYIAITQRHPDTRLDLDDPSWSGFRQTAENFTLRQVWGSWTKDVGHKMDIAKILHFCFNLGYGGLHLGAWDSSVFPTDAERLIWRISSLAIASVFVWGSVWMAFWCLVRSCRSVRRGDWDIIFAPLFGWGVLIFVMARCYLLVEAFISLRNSPIDLYMQVSWTSVLPHAT